MTAIKYLHHTPGRLRLKGHHFNCHGDRARKAVLALQAMPGVERVIINAHAGSLTIHYNPDLQSQATLLATLEIAGCLHASSHTTHRATSHAVSKPASAGEGRAGAFGKALVGVLAQRTATRLISVLL